MGEKKINIVSDNFGIEIKKKLIDIKMTQKEIAKRLQVTEAYISSILSGKRMAIEVREQILDIVNNEYKKFIYK